GFGRGGRSAAGQRLGCRGALGWIVACARSGASGGRGAFERSGATGRSRGPGRRGAPTEEVPEERQALTREGKIGRVGTLGGPLVGCEVGDGEGVRGGRSRCRRPRRSLDGVLLGSRARLRGGPPAPRKLPRLARSGLPAGLRASWCRR